MKIEISGSAWRRRLSAEMGSSKEGGWRMAAMKMVSYEKKRKSNQWREQSA
jgi:hypothetical protein